MEEITVLGFAEVGIALAGAIALIPFHSGNSPLWAIYGVLGCKLIPIILTALFWGKWQAKLADDPMGPQSPYLNKILKTHLIRTLLITSYAFILFVWTLLIL